MLEEPLSGSNYVQVRDVLLAMAQLLSAIDSNVNAITDASGRLRSLVSRIDDFMNAQGGPFFRNLTLNQHTESHQAGPADPGNDHLESVSNVSDGMDNDSNNNYPSSATSIAPTTSSDISRVAGRLVLGLWFCATFPNMTYQGLSFGLVSRSVCSEKRRRSRLCARIELGMRQLGHAAP